MAEDTALEAALRRLDRALEALEFAAARIADGERTTATRDEELGLLAADRARLAGELDAASARAGRLDGVNREVSRRLEAAMETINAVLADQRA